MKYHIIRAVHYGELASECLNAYYQYGRALLYKAQEEADPLGSVPKKEGESQQGSDKESVKNAGNGESSVASVSSKAEQDGNSNNQGAADDGLYSISGVLNHLINLSYQNHTCYVLIM